MKSTLFVVVALGFWGKGDTLKDAATQCLKAGAKRNEPVVGYAYHGQPEALTGITVDDCGCIRYPQDVISIRLFGPSDSKIKLSSIA